MSDLKTPEQLSKCGRILFDLLQKIASIEEGTHDAEEKVEEIKSYIYGELERHLVNDCESTENLDNAIKSIDRLYRNDLPALTKNIEEISVIINRPKRVFLNLFRYIEQ